ncbi:hypothetical protein TBLA_0F04280 [Henningerozyma blattae CBS 6284]|uniref:Flavodoxin-like fold domain-containing protein n=1 Tax=Henningerozyma blattae (strain ATCC 34711 / CBS 6284 / DSM 70876 / NBRC 10599 / NRRL Y-10934 / UCD 77-7) TaxID=1071380 RepID=I2H6F9_HENB6|nr:hypothetical protein TBLA_0F04280 [Tetrapisispora blattae CBS 6284]CCH61961.1 hypothetical protein TBLA_0F04280 [Tetrapisispora blattae CBS 6284]
MKKKKNQANVTNKMTNSSLTSQSKNALIVLAHPESHSLNHSLMEATVKDLKSKGYQVKVSDLYAMNWDAFVKRSDFKNVTEVQAVSMLEASGRAYTEKALTEDVMEEQAKIEWADLIIFQFPLWWYSMPAILKGWFDRVFSNGFAYGFGFPRDDDIFSKKKALIMVTIGAEEKRFSRKDAYCSTDVLL